MLPDPSCKSHLRLSDGVNKTWFSHDQKCALIVENPILSLINKSNRVRTFASNCIVNVIFVILFDRPFLIIHNFTTNLFQYSFRKCFTTGFLSWSENTNLFISAFYKQTEQMSSNSLNATFQLFLEN